MIWQAQQYEGSKLHCKQWKWTAKHAAVIATKRPFQTGSQVGFLVNRCAVGERTHVNSVDASIHTYVRTGLRPSVAWFGNAEKSKYCIAIAHGTAVTLKQLPLSHLLIQLMYMVLVKNTVPSVAIGQVNGTNL